MSRLCSCRGVVFIAISASLCLGWVPFTASSGLSPESISSLKAQVEQERVKLGIPGLTIAISHRGKLWTEGFGVADLERGTKATPQSVYRIASVAKPMTAVGVMLLVEQGKINLDADIREYVSAFPCKPWVVTPRHLLSHLGGIRAYRPGEIASNRHYLNVVDPLAIFANDPLESQPGTKYLYSTYGFNLLGAAVEKAAGMPFVEYMSARVFKPAGMKHTREDNASIDIPNRVRGYRHDRQGKVIPCLVVDTSNKIPGGGLCATAADLVAFGNAFQEGRLVRPATRDLMLTERKTSAGMPVGYGLGWYLGRHEGLREIYHTGGQPGTSTLLLIREHDGLTLAILSNLEGVDLKPLARSIANRVVAGAKVSASVAR